MSFTLADIFLNDFQLKLQMKTGTSRPLPIKKEAISKITLKKLANEPLGARFWSLSANWDALMSQVTQEKNFFKKPVYPGSI